jgi:hypothetical protein
MKFGCWFLLSITVGCGGVASMTDAEVSPIDVSVDVPIDAPRTCDPTKPFGSPTVVPNINSSGRDEFATLTDDLTIYWASNRTGGAGSMDLYLATRASHASSFMNPTPLASVNGAGTEQAPSLPGDELTMYYAFSDVVGGNGDIYATKRANIASAFLPGTPVAQLNLASDDGDPFVTANGSILYFVSNRPGGTGSYDIYKAVRRNDGSFDLPHPVSELNTPDLDAHPMLTADGLTIYWTSTRAHGGAQGEGDLWSATRSSISEPFVNPTPVRELNSDHNDSGTWIAPDGCRIYLATDRLGDAGGSDIWEAAKPM